MNKKIIAMLDTETCPIVRMEEVDPYNMLTYDIGYAIVDLHGNTYLTRSFVVVDTFFGEEERMNTSYYANKLPQYRRDIAKGERLPRTWQEIRAIIAEDFATYGVSIVCAHNARFDYGTLKATKLWLNEDYLLPYGVEWWDTLKMARDTIATKKSYIKFCEENGYLTKWNKPQTKAEVLYKYLINDTSFVENHTGLEDVEIEKVILWACYKMHKKMDRNLFKPREEN